jgi:SAM-dependent methyltransferase
MDEQRTWWETLFQIHEYATYPELARNITSSEVDFLESVLGLQPTMTILDLACGNGRHLLELARRGYRAEGVELATPIVAHVAEQIQAEQLSARIIQRDMRDLAGLGPYDVVLVLNSSLGFFSDAEHQTLLRSIHTILAPHGTLLLQCLNPYQISSYMLTYRRGWHAVGPGYVLRDSHFNPLSGSIETAYRYIEPDGGETTHPGERIRLYTYLEWLGMLRSAGFQPSAVFGDAIVPCVPFDESSQWQIIKSVKGEG